MIDVEAEAKRAWSRDRAYMAKCSPKWDMPCWSKAPAWRRKPYLLDAQERLELLGKTEQ